MNLDPELDAMSKVYDALKNLEKDKTQRIIKWVSDKLEITDSVKSKHTESPGKENSNDLTQFESMADLFAAVNVNTDAEKTLLVASYIQVKENKKELTSREINDTLKHMGHGLSNITSTISTLLSKKPQLMIQTRKDGSSQQAQKKYKVTTEGLKEIQRILSESNSN